MAGDRGRAQLDLFTVLGADVPVPQVLQPQLAGGNLPAQERTPRVEPVQTESTNGLLGVMVPPSDVAKDAEVQLRVSGQIPVIQDAGAELVFNRRNRVRAAYKWDDVAGMNATLKVKEVVKGNVWIKPDYAKLIEDGMPPIVAHLVKQVYDDIAAKPVAGRMSVDDALLLSYMDGVQRIEAGVMRWVADRESVRQWVQSSASVAAQLIGERISLSAMAGRAPKTLLESVYPGGWRNFEAEVRACGGNKVLAALQPGLAEARVAVKAIGAGWPAKREAWEIQGYSVVSHPEVTVEALTRKANTTFLLFVDSRPVRSFPSELEAQAAKTGIKPFALFGKRGFLDSFESEAEALASAKERTRKGKTKAIGEQGTRVESVERVGVVRRLAEEDISSARLMDEFGLKGVNFGNWMKTPAARAEAQLHLNHAFDSFHDLAEIMGIPPKAISLNGMLGLAIGAQGSGGFAAAHFVPGVNEINLTRLSGAGSVAHEWAHALDHYFAGQAGLATNAVPFLSEHVHLGATKSVVQQIDGGGYAAVDVPRFAGIRPEIVASFQVVVDAMNKRDETPQDIEVANQKYSDKIQKGLTGWLAAIRRDFAGLEDQFATLEEKIKKGDVGKGHVAVGRSAYLSPALIELRDLYKTKHGRVYSIDNLKALQSWVHSAQHHKGKKQAAELRAAGKVPSNYAQAAAKLDEEKGGKPYWGTDLEKMARAFDAFVSDELEAKQAKNGYLSHTGRTGETVPNDAERLAVNAAFKTLLGAVQVRESERGPVLFSNGQAAASGGMSFDAMQAEILRLRGHWKSMPSVTVVKTYKDLPFESLPHADGAYCAGRVYVVADNIRDLKQLQKVMAHECVMHHGLEEMLGSYGFSKLHHGIQKLKADGDPTVTALAANILSRYGELPPEIETREIVARAGEQCLDESGNVKVAFGFMKSVFAGITGWLRDHGISVPFTNTELQGIMHNAGEWIKKDGPGRAPVYPNSAANGLVLNSFAGVRAITAPLETLRVAREMLLQGEHDRDIWDQTGWTFAFPDGQARFEISDDQANIVVEHRTMNEVWRDMSELDRGVSNIGEFIVKYPEHSLTKEVNNPAFGRSAYQGMNSLTAATARDIEGYLKHHDLYAAYPELAAVKAAKLIDIDGSGTDGAAAFVPSENRMEFSKINNPDEFKSIALHEMQHAIQRIEGFSLGGDPKQFGFLDVTDRELGEISAKIQVLFEQNPEFYRDVVKANQLSVSMKDKYGSLMEAFDDEPMAEAWKAAVDRRNEHPENEAFFRLKNFERQITRTRMVLSPVEQYTRLAGEAEARLTQVRADMSAEDRRVVYPLDNLDVPVEAQALRFDSRIETSKFVQDGFHVGRVLDVADGLVLQRSGPSGVVVRHAAQSLAGDAVRIGAVIEVAYTKDGVGQVKDADLGLGLRR